MDEQHGVIARRQLLELGLNAREVERRIASGLLRPVWRGVYAVGRPQLDQHGRWMAAVLACGPDAVLSHSSAAALWGFGRKPKGWIEVSVPASTSRRRPEIRTHRRAGLKAEETTRHKNIPVTSPVRTVLDPLHFRLSDSDLEVHLRSLARPAGLPVPETKVWVNGSEVDAYWPELKIVVEADGLRYHRTPSQQRRGLTQGQAHLVAGMWPLRFSHWQIAREKDYVVGILRKTAARARG